MFYKLDNEHIFRHGKFDYEKAVEAAGKCASFELDNDEDELVTSTSRESCYNCLFRKWTYESFNCMKKAFDEG